MLASNDITLSVEYSNYTNILDFIKEKFLHEYYILVDKKYSKISNNKLFNNNIIFDSTAVYTIINSKSKCFDLLKSKKYLKVLNLYFEFNYEKIENNSIQYYDLVKNNIEYNILEDSGIDYFGLKMDGKYLLLQIYAYDKRVRDNIYNFFTIEKKEDNEVK